VLKVLRFGVSGAHVVWGGGVQGVGLRVECLGYGIGLRGAPMYLKVPDLPSVWGLGFMVSGSGLRVRCSGCRGWVVGASHTLSGVEGLGCGVQS